MSDVKERPILFSAPMVRAILDGRKTMTRRVVKLRDKDLHDDSAYLNGGSAAVALGHGVGRIVEWREQDGQWFGLAGYTTVANIGCPYGQVGDRLYVKETFRLTKDFDGDSPNRVAEKCRDAGYKKPWAPIQYEADGAQANWQHVGTPPHGSGPPLAGKTRVSIHMPRWACRIELEVTGVRVERLLEISEADAINEGLVTMPEFDWDAQKPPGRTLAETTQDPPYWDTPKTAFQTLWESIYGAESWLANPWVWVVEFKRIE